MTDIQDNQEIEAQTTEPTAEDTQSEGTDTERTPVDNSEDAEGGKVHREAAKYRTQLRETETALETMTGQRNQLATALIEHQLPGNVSPAVFWKLAEPVTAYLDDNGSVDTDKVQAAAKSVADDLGINQGPVVPGQDKRPDKINTQDNLAAAFSPKK